jgi:hypothetical protein
MLRQWLEDLFSEVENGWTMQQITVNQLTDILRSRRGAFALTVKTVTVPDTRSNCPFDNLTKVSIVNGMGGWIYENSVNNQRVREEKEPDFSAYPRRWGERLRGTPFVTYQDKLYLELKVQKRLEEQYFSGQQSVGLDIIGP